jgi:hypothetical protein
MDADFTRLSRYTHIYWMHSRSGAGSLDWYKTPNSPRPHPFIRAELLTQVGQLFSESGGKARESSRTVMLLLL